MKIGRYIIGMISGLTFGMLFAPKRGKDLRKELMQKSSESGAEGFKVMGDAFKVAGEDALKELKSLKDHEQVTAFLELSQEKMHSFLDAADEKGYDIGTFVQDKLEKFTEITKGKVREVKEKTAKVEKAVEAKVVAAKKNITFVKRKAALKTKVAKAKPETKPTKPRKTKKRKKTKKAKKK